MKSHMKMSSAAIGMLKAKNSVRADPTLYKFLLADDTFSGLDSLHPHLLEGLQSSNYQLLTNV